MTHNPETVERVAKAMWDVSGKGCDWSEAADHLAGIYRHRADAALSALPPQEARPSPKVRKLVWDVDGRSLKLDGGLMMGKGYDWDGYEVMRQEALGLGCGYIIWPDSISSDQFSLYGTADGLYIQSLTEPEAKAAAQADYEARILGALE